MIESVFNGHYRNKLILILLFKDEVAKVMQLLSIKGKVVCGSQICPAPLLYIPLESVWSAIIMAADAENM